MRLAAALVLALALALPAAAPAAEPRTSLPDIEDEVMCVLCNTPLNVADAPQATQQRDLIRELVAQGMTKEQVKARLVAEYGEDVLALPEDDGIGIAAYAVPIVIVLALLVLGGLVVPRWRRTGRTPVAAPAGATAATDAELERLDEDLKRYE